MKFEIEENDLQNYIAALWKYLYSGYIVLSTPILTNAGKTEIRPLSACAMPPIKNDLSIQETTRILFEYHINGMGTGFILDGFQDPTQRLHELNNIACLCAQSGLEDRPVGNIAICSVDHPRIHEFIKSKISIKNYREDWKFNISIGVTENFMDCAISKKRYIKESTNINAYDLLKHAALSAHECGDPGIIFIDRIKDSNPDESFGSYQTVAPCGEMGLIYGETCHFGYINLGKFIEIKQKKEINYDELARTVVALVRALDDFVEISLNIYSNPETLRATADRRKIGVGVCGFADLLFELEIPYDSKEASGIASDLMSFINFYSKNASHELAKQRGTVEAIMRPTCKYSDPNYLIRKFCKDTAKVKLQDWMDLARTICRTKQLRNINTTAIPPTGRSAALYEASAGIEPVFSLYQHRCVHPALLAKLRDLGLDNKSVLDHVKMTGSVQRIPQVPLDVKAVFKTALEIPHRQHIDICAAFQEFTDEAVSKTVNLSARCTVNEVLDSFFYAHQRGLKGITVYRDGSRKNQPIVLGEAFQSHPTGRQK